MCWLAKARGQAVVLQRGETFRSGLVLALAAAPCWRALLWGASGHRCEEGSGAGSVVSYHLMHLVRACTFQNLMCIPLKQ